MHKPGGKTAADYSGPDFSVYPGAEIKDSLAAYFEGILPEVQRRAEIAFKFSHAEQQQEKVQEVLCTAREDLLCCVKNKIKRMLGAFAAWREKTGLAEGRPLAEAQRRKERLHHVVALPPRASSRARAHSPNNN